MPPHLWHCTSISQLGSVKGKWCGRKRVTVSGPYICTAMLCSMPFRSAKVMCLSTTRPSIWWNIGLWVASTSSLR